MKKIFCIPYSYILKQLILKELYETCSLSSGSIFFMSVDDLYLKIPYETKNKGIAYEKKREPSYKDPSTGKIVGWDCGGFIDHNPYNKDRFLITKYDVNNILSDMEKEGLIKQDSSKEKHYHNIILQLKGKEFYKNGGFTRFYLFKTWLKRNEMIVTFITAMIAIIISIIAL